MNAAVVLEPSSSDLAKHMLNGLAICRLVECDAGGIDFEYLYVNDAFVRLTGFRDVVGRKITEVVPGIERELLAAYEDVVRTGRPRRFERYIAVLGAWYEMSAFRTEDGNLGVLFDVATERRRTREALDQSEQRFEALLSSLDDLVFGFDLDGRFTDWHAPSSQRLYREPSDFLGKHFSSVLPADVVMLLGLGMNEVSRTGKAWQFDYSISVDGVVEWWSAKVSMRRGGADKAVGFTVVSRNITELRRADTALRESEARMRAMFDVAPLGMALADPRTARFLRVNERMATITGYSVEELLSMTVAELTHPDDAHLDLAMFGRLLAGSDFEHVEKRYVRKDGTARWVSVHVAALRECNHLRTIATIEDITERREAESALRLQTSALDAAGNGIVITDTSAVVQWVNAALCKQTGYTPAELVGQNMRVLQSGRQPAEFYRDLWSTISSGCVWRGELVNRRKDGSLYDEEMTIMPVRAGGTSITHFVGIKQDITERKRAAAALRSTEEQLRAAQRMEAVGRLAGGVAHDFNNLLSVILSYAELTLAGLHDSDPLHADIQEIFKAGKRAEALTRQLLAFSRHQILEPVQIRMNELIDGIAKMLRRLIGEDVELEIEPGDELHEVLADRGQIEQVLMNLLVNSRDAMPDGGVCRIRTRNAALGGEEAATLGVSPGAYVEVIVADDGFGMDAATRERMFEPFFTTKERGKGTGLGLSMVYGIVRQSGGAISVESSPGEGTTFHIYLPEHVSTGSTPSLRPSTHAGSGNETILVVEDEAALRSLVSRVLTGAGYRVHLAASGAEAIRMCDEIVPDLLLTDVIMPGMSGRDLAERVVSRRPDAKVVFMSGYTDDALARHGVLDAQFLRKPFDRESLMQKVRRVLDG